MEKQVVLLRLGRGRSGLELMKNVTGIVGGCRFIHCSKKFKQHFENTSDLNVKTNYVGYLYRYGQGNVEMSKGHIF